MWWAALYIRDGEISLQACNGNFKFSHPYTSSWSSLNQSGSSCALVNNIILIKIADGLD